MTKKIISKCGKRHRPEIDMMEYIQTTENQEFDLDKHSDTLSQDDIDSILKDTSKLVKKKSTAKQVNIQREPTVITDAVKVDIEQNDQLIDEIENNEV